MTRTLMSRRIAVAGTALLAGLLLGACGSTDHATMPSMSGAAPASGAAATFNDADVAFAQHMIPHHEQAVTMAALADTRATDAEVKKLAAQIKAAQNPEMTTMTGWLQGWGRMDMGDMDLSHDTMPGMMSDDAMKKLGALSGKEFDQEFLHMMIEHHQGAIEMANQETSGGSNPEAKALAQQIITGQQAEIDAMKQLLTRV